MRTNGVTITRKEFRMGLSTIEGLEWYIMSCCPRVRSIYCSAIYFDSGSSNSFHFCIDEDFTQQDEDFYLKLLNGLLGTNISFEI